MDLPMWFILVASLLLAVHAQPADPETKELKETNEPSHPSKVQKREPQVQMKEVILYITPSQIKAIEAGLIQPQELMHTQIHPQQLTTIPKPVTSSTTDQINQQVHNLLNDAGQTIQREVDKLELNKEQNVQQESKDNRASRNKDQLRYVRPEINSPLSAQLDHLTREEYSKWPQTAELQSDHHPNANMNVETHPISNMEKQVIPLQWPDLNKLINAGGTEYNVGRGNQHNTLPYFKTSYEPKVQHIPVNQKKYQQNYAYLYLYPKGDSVDLNKYNPFYPDPHLRPTTVAQQLEQQSLEVSQHVPQESSSQDEQQQKQLLAQFANQQQELLLQADNIPKELHFQLDHRIPAIQAIQRPKQVHFQVENRPQAIHPEQKPKVVNFQLEHRPLNFVSEQRPEQLHFKLKERPQEIKVVQGPKQLNIQLGDIQVNSRPKELQFKTTLQDHQHQRPTELFLQTQHKPKDLVLYSNENLKQILLKQQPKPLHLQTNYNQFSQTQQLPKEIFPHKEHNSSPIQIEPGHDIKRLLSQPELQSFLKLNPNYELVPYEYALKNKLEAQQILIAKLNENEYNTHRLQIHKFKPYREQSNTETEQLLSQTELKPKYDHQLQIHKIENENKQKLEPKELKESDIKKFDPHFQKELMEIMEAQKEKAKIQKEEKEAHRLDSELEEEEKKAEKFKKEQYKEQRERNQNSNSEYILPPSSLKILMKLGPKTSQTHSILTPLFQGHNIADSLQEQQLSFPHNKVQMETGFRPIKYTTEFDLRSNKYALGSEFSPLQYAPKYYGEEYSRVFQKIEQRNRIALERALANAAVLGQEVSRSDKDSEDKSQTFDVVKHLEAIPTTVMVRMEHLLR